MIQEQSLVWSVQKINFIFVQKSLVLRKDIEIYTDLGLATRSFYNFF